MLSHLIALLAITGTTTAGGVDAAASARVRVDEAHREVVVTVGPLHIPQATPYAHHHAEEAVGFDWPVGGWVRGYRLDLLDKEGRLLPREMLHHAGVVNLDRRQLPYPMAERLLAVGRETGPVTLPDSMGVPLAPEQRLVLYYALVNATADPIDGATLRLAMTWTPERAHPPRDVFPLFMDANPKAQGGDTRAYDVPPGVSITAAEFTLPVSGWVRAIGGHLHDYAVEIRLVDVQTNKVLVRLKARRRADGRITAVSSTRFLLKRHGLRLDANRVYRVVGVYDNPTGDTIPAGAMAFMAGPFIPEAGASWPAIDPTNPIYKDDLAQFGAGAYTPRISSEGTFLPLP